MMTCFSERLLVRPGLRSGGHGRAKQPTQCHDRWTGVLLGPWVSRTLDLAIALIAPPRCSACDAPVRLMAAFCSDCARAVEPAFSKDPDAIAAFVYGGPMARSIVRFKYEKRPDLARPLGDLLWRSVEVHSEALRDAIVIPVPLHPSRLAERGYNQAALLGERVARRLGARLVTRALVRRRDTARQATLGALARTKNVAGAFRVAKPHLVRGRSVLLIDDVQTTGATLNSSAASLRDAGVSRIATAVLAVSPSGALLSPAGVS
jgi:ComF family protein